MPAGSPSVMASLPGVGSTQQTYHRLRDRLGSFMHV
jgi:hypothetical protein